MILSAVIFDLDGTIIDSEEVWARAFVNVLKKLGIEAKDSHPHVSGVEIKKNWESLIIKYSVKTDKTPEELSSLTRAEYTKFIPQISLRDGVVEFIENLKNDNVIVALATSTDWEITDKIFQELELADLFDYVTTGDEVFNNKPDPEIYIKSADKMNLDPNDCLVIEDSPSGIIAGKEAGMKVIAIDPSGGRDDLKKADKIVESYSEITARVIGEL
jgi:HAD superfamily hydrolase (TIGR01509 family)